MSLVLGVDPGSHATGWGVVRRDGNRFFCEAAGVIRAPGAASLSERLARIHDGMTEILFRHPVETVAVETPFYARSARAALVLGHARGVILLAVQKAGATLHEYAPRLVKSAVVGQGGASKEQVQFMVRRLLGLTADPAADAADALAVALCHHHRAGGSGLSLIGGRLQVRR